VANTKSFLEKDVAINLLEKKVLDLQEMNELAQEAIARFLNANRFENVPMIFRANITKFQVFSILS